MTRIPSNLGLLIGIPTLGRLQPLQWGLAFKSISPPINYNTNMMVIYGNPVDVARNRIAEAAVEQGAKFLFFLGDDVVVPAHTLKQLIYRMEQHPGIGVVGGVYCSKSTPPAPLVFRGNGAGSYWDWKIGEFFEVTGLGMDCTLIRVDVLKKLSKPWFRTIDDDGFLDAVNHAETWTEDIYFLKKVLEETEYKVYCDGSVICDHYDGNTAYKLPIDSVPMGRTIVESGKKRALDIGCGEINRAEQFPEHTLVRVDIREVCNPDYRCDVRTLPFGNEEFDIVFNSHILEHIPRGEQDTTLREWLRVLKPGGLFTCIVPNLAWAYKFIKDNPENEHIIEGDHKLGIRTTPEGEIQPLKALDVLYGAQTDEYDFHKNGFWLARLEGLLKREGLTIKETKFEGFNLIVKAIK
jgi:SAM-dependent methyltransferase